MKIIRDADTVEFIDKSGDKLVLLRAPRQRDVDCSDDIEQDEAMAGLARLKKLGIDTDAILADAQKDKTALAEAQKNADQQPDGPKVRAFRLKALAAKLVVSGEAIGGEAIVTAYHDMDPESAAWVDARVAEVWTGAQLSEADTRGEAPAAAVPSVEAAESAE